MSESEIIALLPDHLANQIAAGEVIQRPASAVKELLENAIDAGATDIQLIIKDAGKELIQVIDNGKGMSPMDARMAFERHATSKIKHIDDLFSIKTMGFRGEALASIAAVAQVELKTKRASDELGTLLEIAASEVIRQEPIAMHDMTNFAIKNLFYNVPARRKFLKSNTTEYKNIVDEFTRIAMAYPNISFRLFHNNTEQLHLPISNLKSRISNLLGNRIEKLLIPIKETTEYINIYGFIGKPEAATKSRGNQFFFVNNRFIKSPYLHHAVTKSYDGLIEKDAHPFYVIYFELDPSRVDVNVHPTKQEVKFDDEQMLYAYMQSAVKHALSVNNIAPAIDFTLNPSILNLEAVSRPTNNDDINIASNSYIASSFATPGKAHFIERNNDMQEWKAQKSKLFDPMQSIPSSNNFASIPNDTTTFSKINNQIGHIEDHNNNLNNSLFADNLQHAQAVLQWDEYLISTMRSGILLLHKKRATERIAFEQLLAQSSQAQKISQASLFPTTIELSASDSVLLESILPIISKIGYEISDLGKNTYCIQGVPPDLPAGREEDMLHGILDQLKHASNGIKDEWQLTVLKTIAKRMSSNEKLEIEEAVALIDELFACAQPEYTPDGERIFTILPKNSIENLL